MGLRIYQKIRRSNFFSKSSRSFFRSFTCRNNLWTRDSTHLLEVMFLEVAFHWFLDALKMLPVYRIRDGFSSLKKNNVIFEMCYDLLRDKKKLMMFSEGSHHNEYFLKRISKGSSRLALDAQIKSAHKNIYLIPVGN